MSLCLTAGAALVTFTCCDESKRKRLLRPCSIHFLSLKLFCVITLGFYYYYYRVVFCCSLFLLQPLKIYEGQLPHTRGLLWSRTIIFLYIHQPKTSVLFKRFIPRGHKLMPVAMPLSRMHLQLLSWNPCGFSATQFWTFLRIAMLCPLGVCLIWSVLNHLELKHMSKMNDQVA